MDAMDLVGGEGSSELPPKPSRFVPKSRNQPKSRSKPGAPSSAASVKPKTEPSNDGGPSIPVKKEQQDLEQPIDTAKMEYSGPLVSLPIQNGAKSEFHDVEDPMDVEDEPPQPPPQPEVEDFVVREIDVYFNPSLIDGETDMQQSSNPSPPLDQGTQLFLLQYPLRPAWRPYDLDQRCTEIRVKQFSADVEMDLSVNVDSDNYNADFYGAPMLEKETLSSKWRSMQRTAYAIGLFTGNELHLNPVFAVRQLRPSMEHLNVSDSKKKNVSEAATKTPKASSSKADSSGNLNKEVMDQKDNEPYIQLKFRGASSGVSAEYRKKMCSAVKSPLTFPMKPLDYLDSLCPQAAIAKMKPAAPSKSSLLQLPLDQRFKLLFTEGPPIHKFSALKHYAPEPEKSVDDVFDVLREFAILVQGHWVAKTAIRFPRAEGLFCLARDYILSLFSQSTTIKESDIDDVKIMKTKHGKDVLRELAIERPKCKDWKFREPTDLTFMKQYPKIVEEYKQKLKAIEEQLREKVRPKRNPMRADASARLNPPQPSDRGAVASSTASRPRIEGRSMSNEAREALPLALRKLFQSHKVCSIHTIRQGLRSMALNISTLAKADASAVKAAALGLDAPDEELLEAINGVVTDIHGVFVLKSSSDHPELNPLRSVVIKLFKGREANAKLKRADINAAAEHELQKVPSNDEFRKVMNELCKSQNSFWMLKSGDGAPDNVSAK